MNIRYIYIIVLLIMYCVPCANGDVMYNNIGKMVVGKRGKSTRVDMDTTINTRQEQYKQKKLSIDISAFKIQIANNCLDINFYDVYGQVVVTKHVDQVIVTGDNHIVWTETQSGWGGEGVGKCVIETKYELSGCGTETVRISLESNYEIKHWLLKNEKGVTYHVYEFNRVENEPTGQP